MRIWSLCRDHKYLQILVMTSISWRNTFVPEQMMAVHNTRLIAVTKEESVLPLALVPSWLASKRALCVPDVLYELAYSMSESPT